MDIQFLAGVVDSGSHITIVSKDHRFTPIVRLRRSSPDHINGLHLLIPGYRSTDNHGHYWIMYQGKKAITLIGMLEPFMLTKKQHAHLILALGDARERQKKRRGHPLTDEEFVYRTYLKRQIRELNFKNRTERIASPTPAGQIDWEL